MIQFTATIFKFKEKGEKTGWTYIEILAAQAEALNPGNKKSFRVKGSIDNYEFKQLALIPMGGGIFILPLNATIRKNIGKKMGHTVKVSLQTDTQPLVLNHELVDCLQDEPEAWAYFSNLPKSHQQYYSKWIESAKTIETKSKRIILTVNAALNKMSYAEMIRAQKANNQL
jgi:hypothetical protein